MHLLPPRNLSRIIPLRSRSEGAVGSPAANCDSSGDTGLPLRREFRANVPRMDHLPSVDSTGMGAELEEFPCSLATGSHAFARSRIHAGETSHMDLFRTQNPPRNDAFPVSRKCRGLARRAFPTPLGKLSYGSPTRIHWGHFARGPSAVNGHDKRDCRTGGTAADELNSFAHVPTEPDPNREISSALHVSNVLEVLSAQVPHIATQLVRLGRCAVQIR